LEINKRLILLDLIVGLKKIIFGDVFFERFSLIEKENEELKFRNKILEMQLCTLKRKKNDIFLRRIKTLFHLLEVEILELANEHKKVVSRMERIFEMLKRVDFC
jgi:hypothetical protein